MHIGKELLRGNRGHIIGVRIKLVRQGILECTEGILAHQLGQEIEI